MINFAIYFILSFFGMEAMAWFLHKYVMHGFLWKLHYDHHVIPKDRRWQYNDFFALVFFAPSFFSILFGSLKSNYSLLGFGYGIMAYGIAYFLVHEVIIHRRWKFFKHPDWKYFQWLVKAHRDHHSKKDRKGCNNFGMLLLNSRPWNN